MAKNKSKLSDDLPEGMSRRQAKLARRAAERAALEKETRPFGGLASEADLVALQLFVPSAEATVKLSGIEREIRIVTVLPGAVAALVQEGPVGLVALQTQRPTENPGRELAYALNWAATAEPGEVLGSAVGTPETSLKDLIASPLEITEHQDFEWWFPNGVDAASAQGLAQANDSVVPSHRVNADISGAAWWVNPGGGKAHIRWVRTEDDETTFLKALARIAARGELNLGDGSRFAGVFRTHGLLVPVFDLDPQRDVESYADDLKKLDGLIGTELGNDAELDAEERRQLQNIRSRQVTVR